MAARRERTWRFMRVHRSGSASYTAGGIGGEGRLQSGKVSCSKQGRIAVRGCGAAAPGNRPFRNQRVRPRRCRPVDLDDDFLAILSYSGNGWSERASKLAISTRIEIDGHVASERAPGL